MKHRDANENKKSINGESQEAELFVNTDENVSGTTQLNEPVSEETEIERLKAELEEQKDKFLRKVAEFENYKKRNAKERIELIQTAGKDVIMDLLEVLDDCDRAQKQIETSEDKQEIKDGVLLVFNKLRNILSARGLRSMETIHEDFNPDLHDAISEIPALSEELKGKILDEVMKGYYLNDKIIRHAKVVVGK
jgi:molecular chaperone GrpE